jgi:transposase-like protein
MPLLSAGPGVSTRHTSKSAVCGTIYIVLYRAVDRSGQTVDFRLSARRDVAAAKAFFRKAIKRQQRPPQTITLDGYAASHRAVRELKADGSLPTETKLRSSKYLTDVFDKIFWRCRAIFLLARVTAWPRASIGMQARHAA